MSTLDKKYQDLLYDIKTNGTSRSDRTGTGTTAVFGRMISHDMRAGFPLLTLKRTWFKGILHELLWFLDGGTNLKYLIDNDVNIWNEWPFRDYVKKTGMNIKPGTEQWDLKIEEYRQNIKNSPEFAKEHANTGPIYGSQWVDFNGDGINQIQEVVDTLKNNPDSRRILVNALNPSKLKDMTLDPCHYSFQFDSYEIPFDERFKMFAAENLRFKDLSDAEMEVMMNEPDFEDENTELMDICKFPKRYLSLLWNQRSVDAPLGYPFNVASYGLLLMMVAQQVDMIPKDLKGMLGNTHIYNNQMEGVDELLTRDAKKYKLPNVKIKKAKDIFSYKFEDFELVGYSHHPKVAFKISV